MAEIIAGIEWLAKCRKYNLYCNNKLGGYWRLSSHKTKEKDPSHAEGKFCFWSEPFPEYSSLTCILSSTEISKSWWWQDSWLPLLLNPPPIRSALINPLTHDLQPTFQRFLYLKCFPFYHQILSCLIYLLHKYTDIRSSKGKQCMELLPFLEWKSKWRRFMHSLV